MSSTKCRFCGKELTNVFADLGLSPLSNEYVSKADLNKGQYFYPLVAHVCDACFLVQAMEFSKPENIFSDYQYFSSFSKGWLEHSKAYVDMIVPQLKLDETSSVAEIACNDGYLLQYFMPYGIPAYGIEPAKNVAAEAEKKGIEVEVSFFSDQIAPALIDRHGKADLIIGNNVLAHVPDINSFVEGLRILLKEDGVVTMEFPHLLRLMQLNQFDTIYHEHFSYLSLLAVQTVFAAHGLQIVKVEELQTHGGSIRVYAKHTENAVADESVGRILRMEMEFGLDKIQTYTGFNERIRQIKRDSLRILTDIKNQGKKVAAFGAAAKGNTFLNFCGIGKDYIDFVVDSNTHKQGLYLPGTRIPIVSKNVLSVEKPDYIVILPWNLRSEIVEEIKALGNWDYKLITFIPEPNIF